MAVTQVEIAKQCGVSQQTVSCILTRNKAHLYSPEVREKVLKVAKKLGYTPNSAAVAVSKGRRGSVMLVCPSMHSIQTVDWGYVLGLQKGLISHGEHLVFAFLDDIISNSNPTSQQSWNADGVIIAYVPEFHTIMSSIRKKFHLSIPVVWFNDKKRFNAVYPDEFQGAKMVTEFLIRKGHHQIAYLHYAGVPSEYFSSHVHYSIVDRYQGYRHAMEEAGLQPWVIASEKEPHGLYHLGMKLDEIFQSRRFPTAFICYCPETPNMILHKALFHGISESEFVIASFRSCLQSNAFTLGRKQINISIPTIQVGEIAAKMLIHKLNTGEKRTPSQTVPYPPIEESNLSNNQKKET